MKPRSLASACAIPKMAGINQQTFPPLLRFLLLFSKYYLRLQGSHVRGTVFELIASVGTLVLTLVNKENGRGGHVWSLRHPAIQIVGDSNKSILYQEVYVGLLAACRSGGGLRCRRSSVDRLRFPRPFIQTVRVETDPHGLRGIFYLATRGNTPTLDGFYWALTPGTGRSRHLPSSSARRAIIALLEAV
jgi:hypothetical protein